MRFVTRALLFVLIVLAGTAGLGYYWTFVRSAPDYDRGADLPGLSADVTVYRDRWGVPELHAATQEDLFRALGYVHAQERLWQMTVSQMTVDGRFAAHFGADLLPVDRFLRTMDFAGTARKNYELATDEEKRLLQAYADGVNARVALLGSDIPLEFSLARIRPARWEPYHSLGIARLMAWQLNVTWEAEMAYAVLQQRLSDAEFRLIQPDYWPDRFGLDAVRPSSAVDTVLTDFIQAGQTLRDLLGARGSHQGSNAWAVAGSRSASGRPLLAGDPHLGLAVPGVWFEAVLHSPGMEAGGVTIPGVPGVVLGQTRAFAWSFTNVMADDADFFIEQEHPADSLRYLARVQDGDSTWAAFDLTVHYIEVRDADPVPFVVKRTGNGPVINNLYSGLRLAPRPLLSMNWTGLHPSAEFRTLLEANRATDRRSFQTAISHFKVPSQNVVFADTSGFIARWTMGKIPADQGKLPLFRLGWEPSHQWSAFWEFDALPHDTLPGQPYVATANNAIGDSSRYLSRYWEPPSRYNRIVGVLDTAQSMTVQRMQALAYDVHSEHARDILALVMPVFSARPNRSSVAKTYSYLANWDHQYTKTSTAAGIFDVFFLELTRSTLEDRFGTDTYKLFTRLENVPVRAMFEILQQDSLFFDRSGTPERETRDSVLLQALDRAVITLEARYGTEPHQWRWENLHTLTLLPPVFGQASEEPDAPEVLKLIVSQFFAIGPSPSPGHGMTVNNGQYDWSKPFRQVLGPSVRRTADLADTRISWSVLPAGQSGNPVSIHYDDQHALWLQGKSRPIHLNLPETERRHTLILKRPQ